MRKFRFDGALSRAGIVEQRRDELVGFLGYAAILAVLIVSSRSKLLGSNGSLYVLGLCLAGFIFTVYLIYVEIALIRALCPFCLASQAIMTLLFAISVILLRREPTT